MENKVTYSFIFVFVSVLALETINCESLMESYGTAKESVDGEMLFDLGKQLNKPVLTLIGMAIQNINPCDEWMPWSECGKLKVDYVAVKTRKRQCKEVLNTVKKTTETDIGICERVCPKDYNVTTNGFCAKLYVDQKTFDDAEEQCQTDGGHVINIDSELKNGDIKNLLQGFWYYIYVDGRRKNSSSAWLTINGSQKKFFNWASGEPHSGLCTLMHYSNSYWYDSTVCTSTRPFICEI